jgi:hypothetical protein
MLAWALMRERQVSLWLLSPVLGSSPEQRELDILQLMKTRERLHPLWWRV